MANPFRVFRRHQKGLLAVLGLMAMVSFVILPIYLQNMERQARRNPLVVSTARYGNVDEEGLVVLRHNHVVLEQFFEQLARQSQQAQGDPSALEQMKAAFGNGSERELIEQWLLENRADALGLDIGEDAITQDLTEALTAAKISNEQVNNALRSVGISQDQLFSLLRRQMLVRRLVEQFNVSLAAMTPEQRWDYYQRLHRKAAIEVAGLPVSDFVGEVNDPGDAVLKEYFEKYKTRLHVPVVPTPGFKEPKRVSFEYLKADYNKLTEVAKVSEEEIQKYYREHKEDLYKQTLPELPGKLPLTPPSPPARAKPPAGKPAAAQPAKPADAATRGHGDAEKEKPAAEKPAKEKADAKPPLAPAATPASGGQEKPAAEKPDSSAAKKSSALPSRSPFHLTACSDDSSSEKKPEATAGSSPDDKAAGKSPQSKPAEKPAVKADKKAEEKPAAKPAAKPEVKPEAKPPLAPAATPAAKPAAPGEKKQPAPAAKQEPPPPSYTPLEKVHDEIRRDLARAKVRDLLEHLRQQLQEYHGDLAIYESQSTEENAKPPVRPDFKKLAKETGLENHDSGGLLDVFEARALDIGSSYVEGRSEFISVVYQKLPEFLPRTSTDPAGNQYLFWKTKETPEKVPEWSKDVRAKVLAAWKLEQARGIAQKEAERLAKFAQKSKQPLEKVFVKRPKVHVYPSDPFTWLTEGAIPGSMSNAQPEISPIHVAGAAAGAEEAVQTPGNGFMQAVFHRDRGDVGMAMNQPETTVYVFRITEMTPASWDAFVSEGSNPYSLFRVAYLDRERVLRAWFKSIEDTAGLKWEREPVEAVRGEE
jgi:hypothetical protein